MKRKPITVAFRAFCLSLLFVMSAFAAAQAAKPMKLTGRVVDPDGFSLVGVTITIKGTTKGVTTDSEGKYELDVNAEDIVVYSYIGYKTQEILAKEADRFAVVLQPESQEIENVVVVAFGTQKKESVVASVSTVDPGKLYSGQQPYERFCRSAGRCDCIPAFGRARTRRRRIFHSRSDFVRRR